MVTAGMILFGTMTPVGSVWIHESVDPWAVDTTPKSVVKDTRGNWVKLWSLDRGPEVLGNANGRVK